MEGLRFKNLKYDRNVQLTHCFFFLINIFVSVCIIKKNKTEVQKQSSNVLLKVGVPKEKLKNMKNP